MRALSVTILKGLKYKLSLQLFCKSKIKCLVFFKLWSKCSTPDLLNQEFLRIGPGIHFP
jgi:hypothetical protein